MRALEEFGRVVFKNQMCSIFFMVAEKMKAAMMQQMLQAAQANQQANNKPLVEFRAGKLNRAGQPATLMFCEKKAQGSW